MNLLLISLISLGTAFFVVTSIHWYCVIFQNSQPNFIGYFLGYHNRSILLPLDTFALALGILMMFCSIKLNLRPKSGQS